MRVACIREHGDVDVLRLEDWDEPRAGEGEAVVDVACCGLNHLDMFVLRGMPGVPVHFPRIPGGDIAGTVRSVGPGVDESWVGRRVIVYSLDEEDGRLAALGEHKDGGLCERLAVRASLLVPIPDEVSLRDAAALPVAYGTAHRMLATRGKVQPGELMLVLGASGGVGVACVQLGKAMGARIVACASTDEKCAGLAALGADHVVNYSREDFSAAAWKISGKKGVDLVVNFTGGDTWVPSIRALRRQGRLVTCGATAGYHPVEDIRYIFTREADILGCNGWAPSDITALLDMVRSGALKPVIDRVLPLDGVRDGLAAIRDRQVFGKVLIEPGA